MNTDQARASTKKRLITSVTPGLVAFSMGQTVLFAVAGPAFREVGLSEAQLGQIVSAAAVVFVFSSGIWGRIADRWGRKRTVVFGLWCYSLISLAFAVVLQMGINGVVAASTTFALLLLLRLAYAAFGGGIQPGSVAMMADISSAEERSSSVAVVGAAFGIGMILGPAAAAVLVGFGILTPLYAIAVLGLLTAVLATLRLPDVQPVREASKTPVRMRQLLPAMGAALFLFLAVSSLQQTLAFRIQDQFELTAMDAARLTGFCFMAIAVATLVIQGGVIQYFKPQPRTLLLAGLPLALAGFAAYGFAATYWQVLAASALVGAGFGFANPGLTAAASLRTGPEAQGQTAGLIQAMMSAGYVFGPITATTLYQSSPDFAVILSAGSVLLAFVVITPWLLTKTGQPQPA